MPSGIKKDYKQTHQLKTDELVEDLDNENIIGNDEGYNERFELKELIDLKLFNDIQEGLSKVTGLAFVTVDYKGEPLTKRTSFSEYCRARRKIDTYKKACYLSDAHGGLEAAIRGKPYIYRCPGGLIDFAVPIVVKGQYLGAVLCGQARSSESDRFDDINEFIKADPKWKENPELLAMYEKTLEIDYEKIVSVADLVHLVINQLVEKEAINIIQEELNRQSLQLAVEKRARLEIEKELKDAELKTLKAQMNPHFMFNVLSSISNLALVEGAKQTEEMSYLFSYLLRYNIENGDKEVFLKEDLENIERYLKVQKIRFGDKLNYEIIISEEIDTQKIPPFVIQTFIENAVNHGIVPKEGPGTVIVEVFLENGDVVIKVEDDGVGMSKRALRKIFLLNQENYEGNSLGIGIQNTRKRLMNNFGDAYDIEIISREDVGTSVIIKIPEHFEERVS
ncbi:MAG: histidine kinase [Firmicutes bacterium HGW-Firmicutes-1]|jgi:ligand-binding sensor protein|nr:MAG: histidine kinase [Firmicutes bacterium HGW-Firmicutes-1]